LTFLRLPQIRLNPFLRLSILSSRFHCFLDNRSDGLFSPQRKKYGLKKWIRLDFIISIILILSCSYSRIAVKIIYYYFYKKMNQIAWASPVSLAVNHHVGWRRMGNDNVFRGTRLP